MKDMAEVRPLKVAIIGSGLSGLSVAHFLKKRAAQHRKNVECHIFEAVWNLPPKLFL